MAISLFKSIDAVLTQGIAEVCRTRRIDEDEAVDLVRGFLEENTAEYYSDSPSLQYDDPVCRLAYVYTYVGAHSNLVSRSFDKFGKLKNFLWEKFSSQGRLGICSLGGGPGSELLGFVRFFHDRVEDSLDGEEGGSIDIDFILVDHVAEWDETWNALVNGLEETFTASFGSQRRKWPVIVNRSFLTLDFTDSSSFSQFMGRFASVDVFVFNYALSEVLSEKEAFEDTFRLIVERARPGAYFLFIDRRQQEVLDFVRHLLGGSDLVSPDVKEEQSNMDHWEQKEDLGQWYVRMRRDPKLKWNAFYALAQKAGGE